ncbi:hypothetical protein BKA57DRAFT_181372 [Linnemannia elongata]|nr:hypothetical protein BKA57DRAFT_181372 [Linnemannia elongata]
MNSLSQIRITRPSGTTSTTGISSSFFFLPCVAVWRERIERAAHSFLLSLFTLSLNTFACHLFRTLLTLLLLILTTQKTLHDIYYDI